MRAAALVVSMAISGCAAVVEADALDVPEAEDAREEHAAVVPDARASSASPPESRDVPRCRVAEAPKTLAPTFAAPQADARCRPQPRKVVRATSKAVRRDWMRRYPTGTLVVAPGCDRLGDAIVRIELERSSGHGGSLELSRFTFDPSTRDWSLLRIMYNHYAERPAEDADLYAADNVGTVHAWRARITDAVMVPIVERARAASVVEPVEHPPPPKPNTIHGMSMSFSSGSFSVDLALVDSDGHGTQQFFVGYPSTGDHQAQSVRLHIAAEPFVELLYDDAFEATLEPIELDAPEVRELFAQRFWAALDRSEPFGNWFLRERYLALTGVLGGDEHVPALLDHVVRTEGSSGERSSVQAINAITALTGFDRRHVDGVARDPDLVARELIAACAR
jgi:hypothetical protein